MTPSLQEAFLDHRGRTYGRVRVISASSWGRLGDILPRCGAIWGILGLEHSVFITEVCKQLEIDDVKLSLLWHLLFKTLS